MTREETGSALPIRALGRNDMQWVAAGFSGIVLSSGGSVFADAFD